MLTGYKVASTEPGGVLRAQVINLLLVIEEIAEWGNGMRSPVSMCESLSKS